MKSFFCKNLKIAAVCVFTIIIAVLHTVQLAAAPDFIGNLLRNNIPENFDYYWSQATSENAAKWGST